MAPMTKKMKLMTMTMYARSTRYPGRLSTCSCLQMQVKRGRKEGSCSAVILERLANLSINRPVKRLD